MTAENTRSAFENIAGHLDRFIEAIRPDMEALCDVERTITQFELDYLRETVAEHLYSQFPDALEEVKERFDVFPLRRAA